MPAFANITVNNHAAAAVTYSTEDVRNGIAKWNDTAQGTPAGFRPISLEVKRATDRVNGVDRVFVKLARPVVNATTGAVDYTSRVNIEAMIPVRATLAERQELYAAFKNFAAHANCQAACVSLEGTY
jgi:hypothetical protein